MTEYVTIEKEVYENLLKTAQKMEELQKRVEELEKRLWIYENPNVPSSKKIMKEDKEERKPEGKRGAPEGHIGATRERPRPNRFIDLKPECCTKCASEDIIIIRRERRLIEDIKIEKVVTEFTQYDYHCNNCREDHVTTHPELPREGIFGPTITGIWEMLHYVGTVPFDRLSKISGNLFEMKITAAGIHNAIYRTAEIFEPTFEGIRDEIINSEYVRSDETSYPFNGENWWLWNLSNHNASLVLLRNSRGQDVLRETLGCQFCGILNSDCLPVYDNFGVGVCQKCWAHILRFAKSAAEEDAYGKKINEMLKGMFLYIKEVKAKHLEGTPEVMYRIGRMKKEIRGLRKNKRRSKITERLRKRLQKHSNSWFTCLEYDFVEPTNNLSEQDIHKSINSRKISGQHRSIVGTHCREIMMSTILTKQKNDVNVFDFIRRGIMQYNVGLVGS